MRDRTSLVLELINNPKTVATVLLELSEHGRYCEKYLATVCKLDVLAILKRFQNAEFTAEDIQHWANAVGGRADIALEFGPDGVVEESLYWLAHPEINWPLDKVLCERIAALYERRAVRR